MSDVPGVFGRRDLTLVHIIMHNGADPDEVDLTLTGPYGVDGPAPNDLKDHCSPTLVELVLKTIWNVPKQRGLISRKQYLTQKGVYTFTDLHGDFCRLDFHTNQPGWIFFVDLDCNLDWPHQSLIFYAPDGMMDPHFLIGPLTLKEYPPSDLAYNTSWTRIVWLDAENGKWCSIVLERKQLHEDVL